MPPYSQLSVRSQLSSSVIPSEPHMHVEPAGELNDSENRSGSDVMLKVQHRLSFECADGSLDPAAEICQGVLHIEDRKQADDESRPAQSVSRNVLTSEKMLDVEKDFMLEQNKDVNISSCIEQAEVNLTRGDVLSLKVVQNESKPQNVEITPDHSIDIFGDSRNQSGEPTVSQNEISSRLGIDNQQHIHQPLSELQVSNHTQKSTTTFVKPMRKLLLSDFKGSKGKNGMLKCCFRFGNDLNKSKSPVSSASGSNLQQMPIQIVVPAKLTSDSNQSARTGFPSYAGTIPTINIHKRPGMGLHLNSIVKTLPIAPPPSRTEMHDASIRPLKLAVRRQRHVVQEATRIFKGFSPEENINMIHGKGSVADAMLKYLSLHGANRILLNTDIKTESCPVKRKMRSEQHDKFDELKESVPKRKRTDSIPTEECSGSVGCKNIYGKNTGYNDLQQTSLSRAVQGYESKYGDKVVANMKKTIISQTDFSNPQYHHFVTPSVDPPLNREFSPSDHLFVGSRSFHDSNSNSSVKLMNVHPSNDADKYGHSGSNSPIPFAKGINISASSNTRAQLSQNHKLPLVGPPVIHGLSSQKKYSRENDNGCNLSDIKENETGSSDHSTPVNYVTIRSPSERRVHHRRALALHNLGSGSSYTLTKARKFILKSVPTLQASALDNSQK